MDDFDEVETNWGGSDKELEEFFRVVWYMSRMLDPKKPQVACES